MIPAPTPTTTLSDDPDGILQLAQDNKKAILLLEAVALLHDIYKLSDKFLAGQAGQGSGGVLFTDPQLAAISATDIEFTLPILSVNLKPIDGLRDLGKLLGLNSNDSKNHAVVKTKLQELLVQKGFSSYVLSDDALAKLVPYSLHGIGHYEKETSNNTDRIPSDSFYQSSVFGVEINKLYPNTDISLTNLFQTSLPMSTIVEVTQGKRSDWIKNLKVILKEGLADTRRSTNEVTLWDWGAVVAALTKATIPFILKHGVPPTIVGSNGNSELDLSSINYRVLSIGVDVLSLFGQVDKLADVLGLQEVLDKGFRKSREILEEDYPLANRIYHDTTGSYFLFPDFNLPPKLERELRQAFEPDIPIWINLSSEKINAEKLNPDKDLQDALDETKKLLAHPRSKVTTNFDGAMPDLQNALWDKIWLQAAKDGKHLDRCPVTRYYPVGYDEGGYFDAKTAKRKVSAVALKRSTGRVKKWLADFSKTVWLDEIADLNGKSVLIAASINLSNWLDGTLESSLIANVKDVVDGSQIVKRKAMSSKFPSPARINRIWETAHAFWQSQEAELAKSVGRVEYRVELSGFSVQGQPLHPTYSYETRLKNVQFSLVYDKNRQKLVMVDNLAYVAKLLSQPENSNESPAKFVVARLREQADAAGGLTLSEEGADPRTITGYQVELVAHNYLPAITILSEPNMFMAIVPGDKAMEVAEQIKTDYEKQFSKVQNRLPLHLNLVFFDRRTPLYSAIDTARRMLDRSVPTETWKVNNKQLTKTEPGEPADNKVCLELSHPSTTAEAIATKEMKVEVSYRLGDGTADFYYPYFFAASKGAANSEFNTRAHHFEATLADQGQQDMVHVSELESGDEVYFMPSTFDFEYLDVTARRFEMNYHKNGGRVNKPTRPFLLQDIDHFKVVWELVSGKDKGLTNSQLKQVEELLAEKRLLWKRFSSGGHDELLKDFAKQSFARAFKDPRFDDTGLMDWAVNGRLDDLLELYTEIMKQDTAKTKQAKKQARSVTNESGTA